MTEQITSLISSLPGWTSIQKANTLYELVKQNNAKVVVEIGTFAGRAAIALASACKEMGGMLYTIDPYESGPCMEGSGNVENDKYWMEMDWTLIYNQMRMAIDDSGCKDHVTLIKKRSQDAVDSFKSEGAVIPIDVIYIDGNFTPEVTMEDVENYAPLVKKDGFLVLNNSDWGTKIRAKSRILELGFVEYLKEKDSNGGEWTVYQKSKSASYETVLNAKKYLSPTAIHEKISFLFGKLEGWMSEKKALTLYNLIIDSKAKVSVEIGFFGMRGTVAMGLAHKEIGGVHYALDPMIPAACIEGKNDVANDEYWKKVDFEYVLRKGYQVLVDEELTQWCNVLRLRSEEAFYLFKGIDVLHLDGNHSAFASQRDVQYYAPLINEGGYVVMDDTSWQHTQEAQQLLINYGFQEMHCEDDPAGTQWKIYQKIAML